MNVKTKSKGVYEIAKERRAQLKYWKPEHDEDHAHGELVVVAAGLALQGVDAEVTLGEQTFKNSECCHGAPIGGDDPWGLVTRYGGQGRVKLLRIAGALIASEIDRLERLYCRREVR